LATTEHWRDYPSRLLAKEVELVTPRRWDEAERQQILAQKVSDAIADQMEQDVARAAYREKLKGLGFGVRWSHSS
jgi:hypothetical protein